MLVPQPSGQTERPPAPPKGTLCADSTPSTADATGGNQGPAQSYPAFTLLTVEYGDNEVILRVDSGSLTITGPEGRCQALWQGDSYHLPITFRITET